MDETTILAGITRFIDPLAVVFAIDTTGRLKFMLTGADATALLKGGRFAIVGRLLPVLPLVLATLWVLVWAVAAKGSVPSWEVVASKGVASGTAAAYAYRVWKVTVLGK